MVTHYFSFQIFLYLLILIRFSKRSLYHCLCSSINSSASLWKLLCLMDILYYFRLSGPDLTTEKVPHKCSLTNWLLQVKEISWTSDNSKESVTQAFIQKLLNLVLQLINVFKLYLSSDAGFGN